MKTWSTCPRCHCKTGNLEGKQASDIYCDPCAEIRRIELAERISAQTVGGKELPPPEGYLSVPTSSPPGIRLTPGLHEPTRPGMLPSQPDGLTFRQRAGQKSIS